MAANTIKIICNYQTIFRNAFICLIDTVNSQINALGIY